jgi:integrase
LRNVQKQQDFELMAFVILAACTGTRKGEILPGKWSEVGVDEEYPLIYTPFTKNKRPKRLPFPALAVWALRNLPSYKTGEYLFPAKPNVKYKDKEKFSKPHAWDLGKGFRRVSKDAGIQNRRIHDLRHFATTMLFMESVADAVILKFTGHRSEE